MESDTEADIGNVQEFSKAQLIGTEIENIGEKELEIETIFEQRDDAFNLDVSLTILDAETDEVDAEFFEALTEIAGKKSFPSASCTKVCKSKGGLTRHINSKHREAATTSESGNFARENNFSLENLTGIVEAIKTSLITADLYGPEINDAFKKAACSKTLFDDVLPLYNKFCRKKNQDKLLEDFYALISNANRYLNCPDSNAATIIMIEIPDRLAGFFKVCQNRGKSCTTVASNDLKIDPSERGPLSYIAGYIVSKLYQKSRCKKNDANKEFQALLQSLKSGDSDNNFILARSRGGLISPSHHLMGIVEEAEICFRKNVGDGDLVVRKIPAEAICESTLSSPVVKSLWENIVLESGIEESSCTQKLCLENIVKLYVRVRSFSYARDYISKYKIKEKQTKSRALRKDLERGKDD